MNFALKTVGSALKMMGLRAKGTDLSSSNNTVDAATCRDAGKCSYTPPPYGREISFPMEVSAYYSELSIARHVYQSCLLVVACADGRAADDKL